MRCSIILLALLLSGCTGRSLTEQSNPIKPANSPGSSIECSGTVAHKANGEKGQLCPEEEIVFADFDGKLRGREIEIARAKFLIGFIAARTTDTPSEIANKAFKTSEMIKNDFGLKYTSLRVLEESRTVLAAMPESAEKEDFLRTTYLVYLAAGQQ